MDRKLKHCTSLEGRVPILCGGTDSDYTAFIDECFIFSPSERKWAEHVTLEGGRIRMASVAFAQWLFLIGGSQLVAFDQYSDERMTNSSLLVSSSGGVVDGPALSVPKSDACAAVIKTGNRSVTVAVLGGAEMTEGGSMNSRSDMEVFRYEVYSTVRRHHIKRATYLLLQRSTPSVDGKKLETKTFQLTK